MKSGKYIFLSIDLCDSTALKRQTTYWPSVIFSFYHKVAISRKEVLFHWPKHTLEFKVWKSIGDEVLLYHKLEDDNELGKAINSMLMIKIMIDKQVDSLIAAIEETILNKPFRPPKQQTKLTMWTAEATTDAPTSIFDFRELTSGNIVCEIDGRLDFIGPDIDYGFRISKEASETLIPVSEDIAAAFIKMKEKNMIVISMDTCRIEKIQNVELKGITKEPVNISGIRVNGRGT